MKIKNIHIKELLDSEEAPELFKLYSDEAQSSTVSTPFNPNYEMYLQLEDMGILDACIILTEDNKIVGFATMLTTVMPHYSATASTIESIFIMKEYRGNNNFKNLLNRLIDTAKTKNSVNLFVSTPVVSSADKVMGRTKGFSKISHIYSMDLL